MPPHRSPHALLDALLGLLVMVTGSCLVTLMGVFLGADSALLGAALAAQGVAALVAVAVGLGALGVLARGRGLTRALAAVWTAAPGWLIFAFCAVNSLVALGELSFYLVAFAAGRTAAWYEHAPLACALASSLAFCALYALKHTPSSAAGGGE